MSKREKYISDHFPAVDYGGKPLGAKVLVQLRTVAKKTGGGIILSNDTRDFNKGLTCLGIVREIGPLAFRNRNTMEPWPEGIWAKAGDVVMVERHVGRRFEVPIPGADESALFVLLQDNNLDWVVSEAFEDIEKVNDQLV